MQSSSQTICSYFLKGKCLYGDKCVNIHPSNISETIIAPKTIERKRCTNFDQGNCAYGNKCHFLHVPLAIKQSKIVTNSYSAPLPGSNPASSLNENKVCKHFLQGKCKYGDNCKMKHEIIDKVNNAGGEIPKIVALQQSSSRVVIENKSIKNKSGKMESDKKDNRKIYKENGKLLREKRDNNNKSININRKKIVIDNLLKFVSSSKGQIFFKKPDYTYKGYIYELNNVKNTITLTKNSKANYGLWAFAPPRQRLRQAARNECKVVVY